MLDLTIDGQKLIIQTPVIISDTKNYLTAFCSFSNDWDGVTKYIHFNKGAEFYEMEFIDDKITADRGLNLSEGRYQVSVHGSLVSGGDIIKRITTNIIDVVVRKSGFVDGEPFPDLTQSVGEDIVSRAAAQLQKAEKCRDDVEKIAQSISVESVSKEIENVKNRAIAEIRGKIESGELKGEPGKDGRDAEVTSESVIDALGYKPAAEDDLKDYELLVNLTTSEASPSIAFTVPDGIKEIVIHGIGSCTKASPLNITLNNTMIAQVANWFATSNRIAIVKAKLIGGNVDSTDCAYGSSWNYFSRSFGAFKEAAYSDLGGSILLYIDGMSAGTDSINKGYKLKVWVR